VSRNNRILYNLTSSSASFLRYFCAYYTLIIVLQLEISTTLRQLDPVLKLYCIITFKIWYFHIVENSYCLHLKGGRGVR